MVRTLTNVRSAELGADTANLLTFRVGLFEVDYPTSAEQIAFFEELVETLEARPEFVDAFATTALPTNEVGGDVYQLADKAYPDPDDLPWTRVAVVTPEYLAKVGGALLEGRDFERFDRADTLPVALVNRSFAEREWPGESPLGKRIRFKGDEETPEPWRTVVGVAPDQWIGGLLESEQGGVYLPLAQESRRFMSIAVRTRGEPLQYAAVVRQEMARINPDLPLYNLFTLEQVVSQNRFFYDFFGSLFAVFGAVALVLATVGLYAVMAFGVSRRTQEIGVRMAFGANQGRVLGMVLRQSLIQASLGLALGLPLAFLLSRLLANILFEVNPSDPITFTSIAVLLVLVALAAALVPARRASRVDPLEALRYA
jgi:putative ABC transport system permease protein